MGRFDELMQLDTKQTAPAPPPVSAFPKLPSQTKKTFEQTKQQATPTHKKRDTMIPRYRDTTIPRHHETRVSSNHDTAVSSVDDEMIEEVRQAVRQVGKEPATQRLSLEEKQAIRSIEFTYGQRGIITSGNEILRIATNYMLQDYKKKRGAEHLGTSHQEPQFMIPLVIGPELR